MANSRAGEDEWRHRLSREQYAILRQKGTEPAFCGIHWNNKKKGKYYCAGCGALLFSSGTKFDSGTGWPSFTKAEKSGAVKLEKDSSMGMERVEVQCASCGGHLGHVFDDGPAPSHKRYCINSASLRFEEDAAEKLEKAAFAAGCFWGVEEEFRKMPGVKRTTVGYMGGKTARPTYELVCTGKTGHAETLLVEFDPKGIPYEKLLEKFFSLHDPTQRDRQGPDVGSQYRSAIFYFSSAQKKAAETARDSEQKKMRYIGRKIATEIVKAKKFWPAEEYHQKYLFKRGEASCHV